MLRIICVPFSNSSIANRHVTSQIIICNFLSTHFLLEQRFSTDTNVLQHSIQFDLSWKHSDPFFMRIFAAIEIKLHVFGVLLLFGFRDTIYAYSICQFIACQHSCRFFDLVFLTFDSTVSKCHSIHFNKCIIARFERR